MSERDVREIENPANDDESEGNASFLRAARDGNIDEVLDYLKGSTDINTSNAHGLNALHLASKEGHIKIVNELIKRGADVDAATKKGNTSLHIASLAGHNDIVHTLVENGAQVNLQALAGFTPLYMASQEGKVEVVKFLLSSGANQGLSTEDGFTPLAVALQQGHERVVTVLLEHDAKGKVRLPALHIAAKKDDVKSAALLLQNEQNSTELQNKGGLVNDTTKSGFTPLHIASHYGNINVANLLIERNADVNFKAKNNITPLHVASRWGKLNMVTLLLNNYAIIDEKTRDGLCPLHCAARSGHDSVVDLLLEKGAPHSAKTKNGLTPLHMAAQGDHLDCARLLLYHKASLNEVTIDYLTPLHVAAHCGNVKTAKLLLDRKCEPNARALNGFTPLHIACKKNRIKVVELLLKYGASIESKTESGLTPLHVASFMGHMNIVIYLIQHNANPNTATVRGETSLHLAARANQSDIIRILLRNGASVDATAREQQTPLHIAARLGNVDNVVLLLQHGAKVDATTKDKYTPLHIAAKEGHEEVAQVLLENEAQHDITTKKGFTPLHIAAKYGNIKVARMLLQKDANPDVQGKNGLTPLHVATHYNHANVAQLLLESKANPHATAKNGYTPLHIAAKKNQMEIATMLLEYGAKANAESKNGFTPLHLAAQEGHTDIVALLLEKDANVNSKAHNGLTPMHLAAQEDKVAVAEILVKHQSETDSSTKAGYTPLHTACHFGQMNMVRFLLTHDASVNATTKVGYTPLHQAAQQGHVQVVSLLLKHQASPNAVTNNGQTPLAIAQKLGYISVVEILKPVTEIQTTLPVSEDKYKVVSPETMQETFISDSEDEGGEDSISMDRGGSSSPLDTSFDKDVQHRHPTQEQRGRIISHLGASMYYPAYLENAPDYEEEMRYYHGETLSPKDKNATLDKSRTDSVFGDYSTLGRDSINLETTSNRDRQSAASTGDMFEDDDIFVKKDYMDAQITSQTMATMYSAPPPVSGGPRLPNATTEGGNRFSSYSGSSFSTSFDPDNVPVDRSPVYSGKLNWKSFLISFMVDARGGAMRGCRHPGVRVIIPPRKCSMPTRVTCRLVKKEKLSRPPPMLEGEGLAARVLEMGPVGTKFLGPVLIEVPHFASLRGKEREVVILRSDNGENWYEHPMQATEDAVTDALGTSAEELDPEEELANKRIKRILTSDLPMYFALVSRVTRVKQESTVIGMEGGVLSSTVVPQVQAVLPEGTLTRPIPVGLQAQPIAPELVAKLLGNRVAVSPIVTIEPRRRKFHKPITLTIPVPRAAQKGMINQYGQERPTLRLLFSLAADPSPAQWEDVTDSKPMTLVDDCVSFTTTVSARFWLIDCQNVHEASQMASLLYQEAVTVPYMAKFVIFAKRDAPEEGKLRIFCMTDDKDDKTLEKQEKFFEVARSRDIEVLEGRPQFVEMAGNLIPVTKSGDQLHVNFRAFRENRLPCTVKIRDQDQSPSARIAFMKEPKVARGEAPQTPICNLNFKLPDMVASDSGDLDPEKAAELRKHHDFLRAQGIVIQDSVNRAEMKLSDIADTLQGDWIMLAQQLKVPMSEINHIKTDYKTVGDQAMAMLHFWVEKNGDKATGNELETALRRINREDVVRKCMRNVERVDDEVEAAAARVAMDQSGFDTFSEEVGISSKDRKGVMGREMSLDVQYDEQDMIKESESAGESPASDKAHLPGMRSSQAAQEAYPRDSMTDDDALLEAAIDMRRPAAKVVTKTPQELDEEQKQKQEAYLDLAAQMDAFAEEMEKHSPQQVDDHPGSSVDEDQIVKAAKQTNVEAFPALREGYSVQPVSHAEPSRVTFSDDVDERRGGDDEEGVHTPPPSPTDKKEPVQAADYDVAEAAARLASQSGGATGGFESEDVRQDGEDTSSEIMYSRAEVPSLESAALPSQEVTISEPSKQIASPVSDGSNFQEEPSPVPEPTLPEGFIYDEMAYEKAEEDLSCELSRADEDDEEMKTSGQSKPEEILEEESTQDKKHREDYKEDFSTHDFIQVEQGFVTAEDKEDILSEKPNEGIPSHEFKTDVSIEDSKGHFAVDQCTEQKSESEILAEEDMAETYKQELKYEKHVEEDGEVLEGDDRKEILAEENKEASKADFDEEVPQRKKSEDQFVEYMSTEENKAVPTENKESDPVKEVLCEDYAKEVLAEDYKEEIPKEDYPAEDKGRDSVKDLLEDVHPEDSMEDICAKDVSADDYKEELQKEDLPSEDYHKEIPSESCMEETLAQVIPAEHDETECTKEDIPPEKYKEVLEEAYEEEVANEQSPANVCAKEMFPIEECKEENKPQEMTVDELKNETTPTEQLREEETHGAIIDEIISENDQLEADLPAEEEASIERTEHYVESRVDTIEYHEFEAQGREGHVSAEPEPEVSATDGRDLTAVIGDEMSVDRREETMAVDTPTLSREQTPERAFGSHVSFVAPDTKVDEKDGAEDESVKKERDDEPIKVPKAKPTITRGPGGAILKRQPSGIEGFDLVEEEGPVKEETSLDESKEEVLEDGTVKTMTRTRKRSCKKILRSLKSIDGDDEVVVDEYTEEVPGSKKEEVVEVFKEPAREVKQEDEVEQVMPDGSKVKKAVVLNRMVSRVRTQQTSFDESGAVQATTEYETDEIVPGTESAFVAGQDSTSSSEYEDEEEETDEEMESDNERGGNYGERMDTRSQMQCGSEMERAMDVQEQLPNQQQPWAAGTSNLQEECVERGSGDMFSGAAAESKDQAGDFHPRTGDETDGRLQEQDEELRTHRVMMKKEVHKKTMLGADGQEHVTIQEDSQVQQDNEPPEELRESMQEIINQFMESDPAPPQLEDGDEGEDGHRNESEV